MTQKRVAIILFAIMLLAVMLACQSTALMTQSEIMGNVHQYVVTTAP